MEHGPVTLHELNGLDRSSFVGTIGWVFEHSPWVAERAWNRRPFADLADLHDAMISEVRAATVEDQLRLLRAHPELGTRAKMSQASATEQSRAGLDDLAIAEADRITALNAVYRDRFGFPFIYAVKGAAKHDILNALETRLLSEPDAERAHALEQVFRIARLRLEEIL
jgi:OHCU decarboxylase